MQINAANVSVWWLFISWEFLNVADTENKDGQKRKSESCFSEHSK